MSERPPAQLVAMLERLGLATAGDLARLGRRVRRLARDLPQFESVWVDALTQARVLTPFQAAEVNAGRGESLRVGPYLLEARLAEPHYVACYRARSVESREAVRLAVIEADEPRAKAIVRQLEQAPRPVSLHNITHVGAVGNRVFAASPWVEGRTVAEWMVHHGRFAPEIVLEIARAMLAELCELEKAGVCHSDVSTSSLVLCNDGRTALIMPGLRGVVRPEEGYAHADLLPEAYDSLAPERIAAGTPPNLSGDIYACGCVWWRLLCGRPPLSGGNSLAKLRAAQAAAICDVRRFAPQTPASLAEAITACLQRDPERRPESMAKLAAILGPPTRNGQEALVDCLARAGRPRVPWTTTVRAVRKSSRTPLWTAGALCGLATVMAVVWPMWHSRATTNGSESLAGIIAAHGQQENVQNVALPLGTSASRSSAISTTQSSLKSIAPGQLVEEQQPNPDRVVAAAYQQPATPPKDLVLSGDGPIRAESLELRCGQCVRGPVGHRATLLVSPPGLAVDQENVRFENIDFAWRHSPTNSRGSDKGDSDMPSAMVRLLAGRAEFRGCSFRAAADSRELPAAVCWTHPAKPNEMSAALPSGRVQLTDCMFDRVAAGLDCRVAGVVGIEIANTLYMGTGPLLRWERWPSADEAVSVVMNQTTLRDSGPLFECGLRQPEIPPGEVAIQSMACVFSPVADMPLLLLRGSDLNEHLLASLHWTGHGSLAIPRTPICIWVRPDGMGTTVDEACLSIAGLVRSEVGFAGEPSRDPVTSRTTHWQAPLRTAEPPGINPDTIPPPHR